MLKDYIIIENALDNVDEIIDLSKNIGYYSNEKFSVDGLKINPKGDYHPDGFWRGYRSDPLHKIDNVLFKRTMNSLMDKVFHPFSVNYSLGAFLHKTPGFLNEVKHYNKWHRDGMGLFAGVVYLNENPKPDSGTSLKIDDTIISVENKFNRLILYNGNLLHSPENFFGENADSSRTTLTIFVSSVTLSANLS